jgi:hypothetical protein
MPRRQESPQPVGSDMGNGSVDAWGDCRVLWQSDEHATSVNRGGWVGLIVGAPTVTVVPQA